MPVEPIAVDIREAARRLSLSPRTVATLIARKELPSLNIGRRRIIPVTALDEFVRRGIVDVDEAAAQEVGA